MTDLVFMPVRRLAELVRAKEVSPVELTDLFLSRLETHGPKFNAVVTLTAELARGQAREAEKEAMAGKFRGPLHGIPYGAKDLLATKGIPTTWGAKPFKDQRFDTDAAVVSRLREAGAILCAKLSMVELAGGMGYRQPNASLTGPGKSPWDPKMWSGGSSSGSGSAVGAGLVPFALGTETWGSILSPANNCGVAGLRPTYDRVSREGAMALCWTLDKIGPLALMADDCGLVLQALADRPFNYDESPREKFRFGVLKGAAEGFDDAPRENFERALETLGEHEVIELPDLPYEETTLTILMAESAAAFRDFIDEGRAEGLTAPEDRYPYARMTIPAVDYIQAMRVRGVIAREIDAVLAKVDCLVAPTRATTASPIDQEFRGSISGKARDVMGAIGNACGLPSITVPSGFSAEGLPTGVQFMARAWEENSCIAAARMYQSKTDWHTKHPEV